MSDPPNSTLLPMNVTITTLTEGDSTAWDTYVNNHPDANLYHLSGWKNVIEKTYNHKTYYLVAVNTSNQNSKLKIHNCITGVLPLVHIKHFIFGNNLISMPFFDMGGILADNQETEQALLTEAISLGQQLKVDTLELRHQHPLDNRNISPPNLTSSEFSVRTRLCGSVANNMGLYGSVANNQDNPENLKTRTACATQTHKVRMLLDLPESSEMLMKSFRSKLRSQIRKPTKEGLKTTIGGKELIDDFYHVFSINMRDLGSPVHSKKLMENTLRVFPEHAKIVVVYKGRIPLACSMLFDFRGTIFNPWASSLRQYGRLSPNMLLYWTMLAYACETGCKYFDFGRSTPDEGTYKFKKQWGAKPEPLHWHYIFLNGRPVELETSEKSKFDKAIQYWKKLPVPVTKIIGPRIRKYISL